MLDFLFFVLLVGGIWFAGKKFMSYAEKADPTGLAKKLKLANRYRQVTLSPVKTAAAAARSGARKLGIPAPRRKGPLWPWVALAALVYVLIAALDHASTGGPPLP